MTTGIRSLQSVIYGGSGRLTAVEMCNRRRIVNIYVGNLSFDASDEDLRNGFSEYGQVASATIIMDKATGKSRGFGFVVMNNDTEAQAAINGMNGKDLCGRRLKVNEAKPRSA